MFEPERKRNLILHASKPQATALNRIEQDHQGNLTSVVTVGLSRQDWLEP